MLLEDYNYFINKAINQYINKMYNAYDVNQQKTDDLRVLKATTILTPTLTDDEYTNHDLLNGAFEVDLPDDYLHILNCVVEYTVNQDYKCYTTGNKWQQGAKRLTADMYSQIINNYFLRPTYKNPYYYINNVNVNNTIPTSDNRQIVVTTVTMLSTITAGTIAVSDGTTTTNYIYNTDFTTLATLKSAIESDYPTVTVTNSGNVLLIPAPLTVPSVSGGVNITDDYKVSEVSYGNRSKVRMEIRYGKDTTIFTLSKVYIDYLKSPQFIRITQDQIDEVEDNSQVLEFPDYVSQEIINEMVTLVMENASDPRLQTHIPVTQSIAQPMQEGTKQ